MMARLKVSGKRDDNQKDKTEECVDDNECHDAMNDVECFVLCLSRLIGRYNSPDVRLAITGRL